jgi:hypothetical protein
MWGGGSGKLVRSQRYNLQFGATVGLPVSFGCGVSLPFHAQDANNTTTTRTINSISSPMARPPHPPGGGLWLGRGAIL